LPEVGFSFFAADLYYETLSSLGALFMDCSAISEDPTYLARADEIYRAFSLMSLTFHRKGWWSEPFGFFGDAGISKMQGFLHSRWSVEMTAMG